MVARWGDGVGDGVILAQFLYVTMQVNVNDGACNGARNVEFCSVTTIEFVYMMELIIQR